MTNRPGTNRLGTVRPQSTGKNSSNWRKCQHVFVLSEVMTFVYVSRHAVKKRRLKINDIFITW